MKGCDTTQIIPFVNMASAGSRLNRRTVFPGTAMSNTMIGMYIVRVCIHLRRYLYIEMIPLACSTCQRAAILTYAAGVVVLKLDALISPLGKISSLQN